MCQLFCVDVICQDSLFFPGFLIYNLCWWSLKAKLHFIVSLQVHPHLQTWLGRAGYSGHFETNLRFNLSFYQFKEIIRFLIQGGKCIWDADWKWQLLERHGRGRDILKTIGHCLKSLTIIGQNQYQLLERHDRGRNVYQNYWTLSKMSRSEHILISWKVI